MICEGIFVYRLLGALGQAAEGLRRSSQ